MPRVGTSGNMPGRGAEMRILRIKERFCVYECRGYLAVLGQHLAEITDAMVVSNPCQVVNMFLL